MSVEHKGFKCSDEVHYLEYPTTQINPSTGEWEEEYLAYCGLRVFKDGIQEYEGVEDTVMCEECKRRAEKSDVTHS